MRLDIDHRSVIAIELRSSTPQPPAIEAPARRAIAFLLPGRIGKCKRGGKRRGSRAVNLFRGFDSNPFEIGRWPRLFKGHRHWHPQSL
jgi:hypothetical protein